VFLNFSMRSFTSYLYFLLVLHAVDARRPTAASSSVEMTHTNGSDNIAERVASGTHTLGNDHSVPLVQVQAAQPQKLTQAPQLSEPMMSSYTGTETDRPNVPAVSLSQTPQPKLFATAPSVPNQAFSEHDHVVSTGVPPANQPIVVVVQQQAQPAEQTAQDAAAPAATPVIANKVVASVPVAVQPSTEPLAHMPSGTQPASQRVVLVVQQEKVQLAAVTRPLAIQPIASMSAAPESATQAPQLSLQPLQPVDGNTASAISQNSVPQINQIPITVVQALDSQSSAPLASTPSINQPIVLVVANKVAAPSARAQPTATEDNDVVSGMQPTKAQPTNVQPPGATPAAQALEQPVQIILQLVTQQADNVTAAVASPAVADTPTETPVAAGMAAVAAASVPSDFVRSSEQQPGEKLAPSSPADSQPVRLMTAWTTLIQSASFVLFVKAACMISNVVFQISPLPQVQQWVSELSTGEADAAPFVAIAFGGWQWCFYGLFAWLVTQRSGFLILVHSNCLGAVLGSYYAFTFSRHCQSTTARESLFWYFRVIATLATFQFVMMMALPVQQALFLSGVIASSCSIASAFSVLVTLPMVIRTKRSDSIPGAVAFAGFASAVIWFFCGLMLMDPCILVPNFVSIITGAICVYFKIKYPSTMDAKLLSDSCWSPATSHLAFVDEYASAAMSEEGKVSAEQAAALQVPPSRKVLTVHAGTGDSW